MMKMIGLGCPGYLGGLSKPNQIHTIKYPVKMSSLINVDYFYWFWHENCHCIENLMESSPNHPPKKILSQRPLDCPGLGRHRKCRSRCRGLCGSAQDLEDVDVAPGWGGLGVFGQYFFPKNKRRNNGELLLTWEKTTGNKLNKSFKNWLSRKTCHKVTRHLWSRLAMATFRCSTWNPGGQWWHASPQE